MEMSGRSGFIRWVKNPTSISFDFHSPYHVLASAIIVLQMYTQMWLVLCTSRVRKFKIFELAHACFRLSSEIFITARAFWRHQLQEIYIYIYTITYFVGMLLKIKSILYEPLEAMNSTKWVISQYNISPFKNTINYD